jgi:hypothetical protein
MNKANKKDERTLHLNKKTSVEILDAKVAETEGKIITV